MNFLALFDLGGGATAAITDKAPMAMLAAPESSGIAGTKAGTPSDFRANWQEVLSRLEQSAAGSQPLSRLGTTAEGRGSLSAHDGGDLGRDPDKGTLAIQPATGHKHLAKLLAATAPSVATGVSKTSDTHEGSASTRSSGGIDSLHAGIEAKLPIQTATGLGEQTVLLSAVAQFPSGALNPNPRVSSQMFPPEEADSRTPTADSVGALNGIQIVQKGTFAMDLSPSADGASPLGSLLGARGSTDLHNVSAARATRDMATDGTDCHAAGGHSAFEPFGAIGQTEKADVSARSNSQGGPSLSGGTAPPKTHSAQDANFVPRHKANSAATDEDADPTTEILSVSQAGSSVSHDHPSTLAPRTAQSQATLMQRPATPQSDDTGGQGGSAISATRSHEGPPPVDLSSSDLKAGSSNEVHPSEEDFPVTVLANGTHPALNVPTQPVATLAAPEAGMSVMHARIGSDARLGSDPQLQTAASVAATDTFSALDNAGSLPATTWIHAGVRHAEAGYLDPTLGWVGVRAESTGAAVHAAIVTGSAETAHVLDTHLAGLNSFITEQHGQSSRVTIASPDQNHFSGGFGQSGDGTAQQQHSREELAGERSVSSSAAGSASAVARSEPQTSPDAQGTNARTGVHISVVA